jgi:hypothetical protein
MQLPLINSNQKDFSLHIKLTAPKKVAVRVIAEDAEKPNSKYADRTITIEGEREIYLSFPISPENLKVTIYNVANGDMPNDNSFSIPKEGVRIEKLTKYNIWIDDETRDFLGLAKWFSQHAGFANATLSNGNPTEYISQSEKFRIRYFNVISQGGKAITTPARIGHNTGTIECSKKSFANYTIPMRMIILLHEFSHKYKNHKLDKEISNETAADVNALYIYLGLGFSKIDAIYVYANVFYKAQSEGNIKRMRVIMDFISKFEAGEFKNT